MILDKADTLTDIKFVTVLKPQNFYIFLKICYIFRPDHLFLRLQEAVRGNPNPKNLYIFVTRKV